MEACCCATSHAWRAPPRRDIGWCCRNAASPSRLPSRPIPSFHPHAPPPFCSTGRSFETGHPLAHSALFGTRVKAPARAMSRGPGTRPLLPCWDACRASCLGPIWTHSGSRPGAAPCFSLPCGRMTRALSSGPLWEGRTCAVTIARPGGVAPTTQNDTPRLSVGQRRINEQKGGKHTFPFLSKFTSGLSHKAHLYAAERTVLAARP